MDALVFLAVELVGLGLGGEARSEALDLCLGTDFELLDLQCLPACKADWTRGQSGTRTPF